MCSFDVQYLDIAQKMSERKVGKFGHLCKFSSFPIRSFFELHQHSMHQKNKFLIKNSNLEKTSLKYFQPLSLSQELESHEC